MKTAQSFTKYKRDVIDPKTNKKMAVVYWPPTKQLRKVPVPLRMEEGSLDKFKFWMYDDETNSVVIKSGHKTIRFADPKDLMRFGKRDLETLAANQIICPNDQYEWWTKEFTGMVRMLLEKGLWAGALADRDVHLMEKN